MLLGLGTQAARFASLVAVCDDFLPQMSDALALCPPSPLEDCLILLSRYLNHRPSNPESSKELLFLPLTLVYHVEETGLFPVRSNLQSLNSALASQGTGA